MIHLPDNFSEQLWNGFERISNIGVSFSIKANASAMCHLKTVYSDKQLFRMKQTHSNHISLIIRSSGSSYNVKQFYATDSGIESQSSFLFNELDYEVVSDAMISNDPSVILGVKTADCLPIFIIGGDYFSVIHAGRVGTMAEISRNVCLVFELLGIDTVSVWFGPASCVGCYEIDRETRTHYDLKYVNKKQIRSIFNDALFFESNVGLDCTQCSPHYYYSFRSGDQSLRNWFYLLRK